VKAEPGIVTPERSSRIFVFGGISLNIFTVTIGLTVADPCLSLQSNWFPDIGTRPFTP
jgi:hypothetical protein